MQLGTRKVCVAWVLAVMLTSLLAACKSSPPAYTPPVRSYKKEPAQAAAANMQLALEYMKLGQLANSRECIEKALKEDPSNPDVQMTAGLVYERINETAKAERAYDAATVWARAIRTSKMPTRYFFAARARPQRAKSYSSR